MHTFEYEALEWNRPETTVALTVMVDMRQGFGSDEECDSITKGGGTARGRVR
jgi:hypothetical protein